MSGENVIAYQGMSILVDSSLFLKDIGNGEVNIEVASLGDSVEISLDNGNVKDIALKLLELSGIDIKAIDNEIAMIQQMSDPGDDFLAVCLMKDHATAAREMLKQLMI